MSQHCFRPPFHGVQSPWDEPSDVVLTARSLMDRIPYGEAHFYQGELIRCQSYHGNYACSCSEVAMSGGDETDSSTQVSVVRSVWAPVAMSYCATH
jgi:hypothetical protein